MAVSITVPTPPGAGQPVVLKIGKHGRQWDSVGDALDWARDILRDRDVVMAVAILRAANRAASRGKTLTFDIDAAANIVREA